MNEYNSTAKGIGGEIRPMRDSDSDVASEVKKPGSIPLLVTDIMQELKELEVSIGRHEQKIQLILTPIPPNNTDKMIEDGSPTDLGRCLVDIKNQIRTHRDHVRNITSRVEL